MKPISFIIPSRNNLKYLKWCYNSIRKNLDSCHEICIADDASEDGTWKWLTKISLLDKKVKIHKNSGPERQGLVVLYDKLIKDYATNDVIMIFHADMYACPGLDKSVFKHIKKKTIVSATRVEPSLHPPGPEKILADYGIEPEDFNEEQFLLDVPKFVNNKTTNGIFAPWALYKKDFWDVGGHDLLFAPTSREDSDIFNRLLLNGCKFIQTWEGLVYHLTSRGSRFNTFSGGQPGKTNSKEWIYTNTKNIRNFIRKWGTVVQHDDLMMPIVSPKYDIGFIIDNCNSYEKLYQIEPWCDNLYGMFPKYMRENYIHDEQQHTLIDMDQKIKKYHDEKNNNILVKFDMNKLNNENINFLTQLPAIIKDSGEIGEMEYDIFKISIINLQTYEKELIKCEY